MKLNTKNSEYSFKKIAILTMFLAKKNLISPRIF